MTIARIYIYVTVFLLQDGGLPAHYASGDGMILGNPPECVVQDTIDEIVNAILEPLAAALGLPEVIALVDEQCMASDECGMLHPYWGNDHE